MPHLVQAQNGAAHSTRSLPTTGAVTNGTASLAALAYIDPATFLANFLLFSMSLAFDHSFSLSITRSYSLDFRFCLTCPCFLSQLTPALPVCTNPLNQSLRFFSCQVSPATGKIPKLQRQGSMRIAQDTRMSIKDKIDFIDSEDFHWSRRLDSIDKRKALCFRQVPLSVKFTVKTERLVLIP